MGTVVLVISENVRAAFLYGLSIFSSQIYPVRHTDANRTKPGSFSKTADKRVNRQSKPTGLCINYNVCDV